jgi:hypothetical protein
VQQLAGKPFALLGVHGLDYGPKKLKEVMEKEKLNWRSLSSRSVAARWSARGTPTYYVIDFQGVIRSKWVGYPGAKAIETVLEELIKEAETKTAP